PRSSASSSSFTNSPLPPTCASGLSRIRSPRVVRPRMLTSHPGCARRSMAETCSDCHIASPLCREAITSRVGDLALPSLMLQQLLQRPPLAPAHRQLLGAAFQYHGPPGLAVLVGPALHATDEGARDQAVAVDAHEDPGELALELRQRILDQVLALARAQGDVLELGLQEHHVG